MSKSLSILSVSFQYKTCKDGSVLGVTVTRIALLTHCQALTQACSYTEGVDDPETPLDLGFWGSLLTRDASWLASQSSILFVPIPSISL